MFRHNLIHVSVLRLMHANPDQAGGAGPMSDADIEAELAALEGKAGPVAAKPTVTAPTVPGKPGGSMFEEELNPPKGGNSNSSGNGAGNQLDAAQLDDIGDMMGIDGAQELRRRYDASTFSGIMPVGLREVLKWQLEQDPNVQGNALRYYSSNVSSANPVGLFVRASSNGYYAGCTVEPANIKLDDGTVKNTFVVVGNVANQNTQEVIPLTDPAAELYFRFAAYATSLRSSSRSDRQRSIPVDGSKVVKIAQEIAAGLSREDFLIQLSGNAGGRGARGSQGSNGNQPASQ